MGLFQGKEFLIILLVSLAIVFVQSQYELFQQQSLSSGSFAILSNIKTLTSSLCSAECKAYNNQSCAAFRYNQTGTNDCNLGVSQANASTGFVFESGNVSTYVGLRYSNNYCFFVPISPIQASLNATEDFCQRNGGGWLPEPRTSQAAAQLASITGGLMPFTGLFMDTTNSSNLIWRWSTDNSKANVSLVNNVANQCTKLQAASPYVIAVTCSNPHLIACQIC